MASAAEIADYKAFAAQMETAYNIPTGLLTWQIGAESSWNPAAKNPLPGSTATGLGQFTAATAQWRGVDVNDPYDSIQGAASYMAYLRDKTGSWLGALESYGTTKGNPAKAAQAAAILAQSGTPNSTQQGTFLGADGPITVYAGRAPGMEGTDAAAGKVHSDTAVGDQNTGTFGGGLISGDMFSWLKKILGGIPLIILGVILIVLALISTDKGKTIVQQVVKRK